MLLVSATSSNRNDVCQINAKMVVQNFAKEVKAETNKIALQEFTANEEFVGNDALWGGDIKASNVEVIAVRRFSEGVKAKPNKIDYIAPNQEPSTPFIPLTLSFWIFGMSKNNVTL